MMRWPNVFWLRTTARSYDDKSGRFLNQIRTSKYAAEVANGLEAVQKAQLRCRPDSAVFGFPDARDERTRRTTREIKKIMPLCLWCSSQSTILLSSNGKGNRQVRESLLPKAEGSRHLSELIHTPAAMSLRQLLAACRPTTVAPAHIKDYHAVFATIESHSSGPFSTTRSLRPQESRKMEDSSPKSLCSGNLPSTSGPCLLWFALAQRVRR